LRAFFIIFILHFTFASVQAQLPSNFISKTIYLDKDTIVLDSLSIIPRSEILYINNLLVVDSLYAINYSKSKIILSKKLLNKMLTISYRYFPINFTESYAHKSVDQIEQSDPGKYDFFTLKDSEEEVDIFSMSGLTKNGSISRGLNFGNNQDLAVNSNLDLQLSGKISDDIGIKAAISDNNLPIQAEGNTQQLREFDRVFIELFNDNSSLIAGDFQLKRPDSYFMNLNKKVQGGGFSTRIITKEEEIEDNNGVLKTAINAAISKGKFSRNVIQGVEGNQGPYRLEGSENESFIIILSGTEQVYINGKRMRRGEDNDYIIDYNTAEIIFTPQQMITKDMRITVEFQYSDRNYSRSLLFFENEYRKEKLSINLNMFSEQDQKNQPLQQDLDDEKKRILKEAGDSLEKAVVSGVDSIGFENDQVMYKMIDSLGYTNVLVYSKSPDSAHYRAKFSRVAQGNYIQIRSDGNGRVFQWVAPQGGIPQGNYEPVIKLVTPKKRQLLTVGAKYNFSDQTKLSVEGAFSNDDRNTFASQSDQSYGFKMNFEHQQVLKQWNDSSKEKSYWNTAIFLEQRGKDFQFIERYRDVEFDRDWNLNNQQYNGDERLIRAKTGVSKRNNFIDYEFGSFTKGNDFEGLQNGYSGAFKKGGLSLSSQGSYLTADAVNKSEFIRHYTNVSQKLWGIMVGGYLEQERITFRPQDQDSLLNNSFDRIIWKAFIQKGDSSEANLYRLTYSEAYDYLPSNNTLNYSMKSENFDLDFRIANNPNSRLSGKLGYRKLNVFKEELTTQETENNLVGRVEYSLNALKGFINSTTFYEIGSGLENQREFSYIKVNDGQGTHLWNDYNGNGVKELDEFEVAGSNNSYQANYIKVYTPSNNFVRVFNNQFNQLFFIRPSALLSGKQGMLKFLGKFSNKTSYRAERKTQLEKDIYNPLNNNVTDSSLVSINASISNTLYFNRLSSKFGMEYSYLSNKSKNLLTNGFESRSIEKHEHRSRFNISRIFSIENYLTYEEKSNESEYFSQRNYTIVNKELEPKLIYQPSVRFRLSLSGIYSEKENTMGEEVAYNRTAAFQLQYNEAGKGTFSIELRYIDISFNSGTNNALAFEMLDGLSDGGNTSWGIVWQRNLSNNLQLNLNYNGRKSEGLNTIHTGGMQLRAFF